MQHSKDFEAGMMELRRRIYDWIGKPLRDMPMLELDTGELEPFWPLEVANLVQDIIENDIPSIHCTIWADKPIVPDPLTGISTYKTLCGEVVAGVETRGPGDFAFLRQHPYHTPLCPKCLKLDR